MTLTQNPSSEPISLMDALEQRADLVFKEKLDPAALAEIRFSDTPIDIYENFKILREYRKMTSGQKMICDRYILNPDRPRNSYGGYEDIMQLLWLESGDLVVNFEGLLKKYVKGGSTSIPLHHVGVLYLADPSEQTLRTICETVKRTIYYKYLASRFSLGAKKKGRDEEKKIIVELQDFLSRVGADVGLLDLFESKYENIAYQARDLDFAHENHLDLAMIEKLLAADLDYYSLKNIFAWLLKRYLSNETFRASIKRSNYFSRILNLVNSNMAVSAVADALSSVRNDSPELEEITKKFLDRVKKLCRDPDMSLKLTRILSEIGEGRMRDEIANICHAAVNGHPITQLVEALSGYSTWMIVEIIPRLSEKNLKELTDYHSTGSLLYKSMDTRVMAALLRSNHGAVLFQRYLEILTADGSISSPTDRRKIKGLVQEALALIGRREDVQTLEAAVEAAIARIEETSRKKVGVEAAATHRRIREVDGTDDGTDSVSGTGRNHRSGSGTRADSSAADEPPPKRPGQLDAAEFTAAIKSKFDVLKLNPTLASNIGVTKTAEGPVTSKIRYDLEQTAAVAIELFAWDYAAEKVITVEENSILARLGIKAVRFRKTKSFDVEFLFKEEKEWEEPAPFYGGVHLDDRGVPASENFTAEPLLKAILEIEALRHFIRIITEEDMEGAGNLDVLRLLGLEAMPEPEPEEVKPKPPINPDGQNDPATPEPDPKAETRNFILENWEAFETFMEHLEKSTAIKKPFRDLHAIVSRLAAEIQVDKAIPNFGVTVEMTAGHILSPHVSSIDIYDPSSSREILKELDIDPVSLHVENLNRADVYLVRLNVKNGKEDEQISACIVPPNWDVYFFGVDPLDIIDNERVEPMALIHLILKAFKLAVMRDDDPDFTSAKAPSGKSGRKGAAHINQIITQATRTSYPSIVTSWRGQQAKPGSSPGRPGNSVSIDNEGHKDIFSKIAVEDNLEHGLTAAGIYMQAGELESLIPGALNRLLAPGYLQRYKRNFREVHIPIEDSSVLAELLQIFREKKFVMTPESEDLLFDLVGREGTTDADLYAALDFLFADPNAPKWEIHPYFRLLCKKKFPSTNPYLELIQKTLAECQQNTALAGTVNVADIYRALRGISLLDPLDLKISTSGATDFRLPYLFREGTKEMPSASEALFKGSYEVGQQTDLEIIKVIAGSRARLSSAMDIWLRGNQRGEDMDFASHVQSRLSSKQPEVDLRPRARALLVWEFMENNGDTQYAYSYLDQTRDSHDPNNLQNIIKAEARLKRFPQIQSVANRILVENTTGTHTDFNNPGRWSRSELEHLEKQGIFRLDRDPGGHITGITPGSIKKILRKKILILTDEQVGYRQFRFKPTNFSEYMAFAHEEELLDPSFCYDPKLMEIQRIIYGLLGA